MAYASTSQFSSADGIIQFENANEGRSYPFVDNASLVDDNGALMGEDVIVDFKAITGDGSESAYLRTVYVSPHLVSACVSLGSTDNAFLSVTVKREEFEPYAPYRMDNMTSLSNTGGIITFGSFEFPNVPVRHVFSRLGFFGGCVRRYVPAKVTSLVDPRTGDSVRGDVELKFSGHIVPTVTGRDDGSISLALKEGSARALASKCDREKPVNSCGATPVTSLNGVRADEKDRIVLWFH